MLRRIDAERLVLSTVRSAHGSELIEIAGERTIERPFGWLFFLAIGDSVTARRTPANFARQVIVNQDSSQIVASSIERSPEEFIKIYEELLAQCQTHAGEWCLTVSAPNLWRKWWERRVRRKAAESGLYEIGGKEKAP